MEILYELEMTQNPQREWRTLLEVLDFLDRGQIPYMLTGSMAKSFYSDPRMTRDIDIVLELDYPSIDHMVSTFEKSFYVDRGMIEEALENSSMFNVVHNQLQVKVDFIIRKNETYRKTEFERRRSFILEGRKVWVTSPEDLVISKLHWAKDSLSEMQLSDVRDLLRSVKTLDYAYLESWMDLLGLREIWNQVKK